MQFKLLLNDIFTSLDISEDEDLAEQRGYDRAWIVVNPYKDKLKKIAGHIVDYGHEITSSIFFEELDISSQKTLKKV